VDIDDSNTIAYKNHMHDLAFAVTYHKMQGQTVIKIILDLNKRPMSLGFLDFHAFYVGISRVKYSDNIRILPCYDIENGFKHLFKLKPDEKLHEWLETVEKM
jgi:ATP-dependent exoDNAse (exonuclease V) alpha subunit